MKISRKRPSSESPTVCVSSGTIPSASSSPSKPAKVARTDKGYKGLRQFSMMVCKKVEEKGKTTYNEVADELVHAVVQESKRANQQSYDEKNIRRRVYDALNVLMAMDIITKERKEITWKGLPSTVHQDREVMSRELASRKQQLQKKRRSLSELLVQQVCFRNLAAHNRKRNEESPSNPDNKIPLPFIIVNTNSSAVIQCNMSKDLTDVMFDFSMPFEINDDNTLLKRLGMHRTSRTELEKWLPQDVISYCGDNDLLEGVLKESIPPSKIEPPPYDSSVYSP